MHINLHIYVYILNRTSTNMTGLVQILVGILWMTRHHRDLVHYPIDSLFAQSSNLNATKYTSSRSITASRCG